MNVDGIPYRTVWIEGGTVRLIEQNLLPFRFEIATARTYEETCRAIQTMVVRGAGAIGATAGYAMAQAFLEAPQGDDMWVFVEGAKADIEATRPTAQNLFYAVERVYGAARDAGQAKAAEAALDEAQAIADDDAEQCRRLGEVGAGLLGDGARVLTHCNAGWLAFVDYGSALSPVYVAHRAGRRPFVYADETRPRSQGARLTAWELAGEGVPHAIVPDNAAAFLMARGQVDIVIVGTDRVARNGDVANKIGTLEKALAAKEYGVPFYVAAPTTTFDLGCPSGDEIPIEERDEDEVHRMEGLDSEGRVVAVRLTNPGSSAVNIAFDVTPARLVTGFITQHGIIEAREEAIVERLG